MRDQTDNVEMVLADRAWPMQILNVYIFLVAHMKYLSNHPVKCRFYHTLVLLLASIIIMIRLNKRF